MRLGHFLAFVGACLFLLADANAAQRPDPASAFPQIRSAQLFAREGRWESVAPRSAPEEQAEIRAHFAAVSQILVRAKPASLQIAAARFEQAYGVTLTRLQMSELLARLAARRAVQLQRLADYASAGRFPLNRHYQSEARPIFVDERGTHCAVGYLMAMDGWETEVLAIARTKPNVLVREVGDGPLVDWVLTSGLIQEEAALIQPGYYPPSTAATNLSDLVVPGASLDRDGFRYENFAFSASSTGGAATPLVSEFALVHGWPPAATEPGIFCGSYEPRCVPSEDTLWFGHYSSQPVWSGTWGSLVALNGQSINLMIEYDVVSLAAGLTARGAETFAGGFYGGFSMDDDGQASVTTTVDGGVSGLLELLLINPFPYVQSAYASALFDTPANQMHVQHSIQIANGAEFLAFDAVTLRAVPLPGTAFLFPIAAAGLLPAIRRRRRAQFVGSSRPAATRFSETD